MYRKRVVSLDLQEVLDKLAAKKAGLSVPVTLPTITTYAPSDILKAKGILDRLTKLDTRNEVSYITTVSKVNDEE